MSEFEVLKQLKYNIQFLINNATLKQAKLLIEEYEKIVKNDIEIYSIKAVIAIMEGKIDYAKNLLKAGIELDSNNFDLNYNLAYVYEIEQSFQKAIKYYVYAYNNTLNEQLRNEIKALVGRILNDVGKNESFEDVVRQNIKKKKCLILCHFYSVFVQEFVKNFKENSDIEFDILTMDSSYIKDKENNLINKVFIYSNINELIDILKDVKMYDIIHIHFLDTFYSAVSQNIKEKCNKLIVSIWGSDFYRMLDENRIIQERVLDKSDFITMANENTIKEFDEYYKFKYSSKLKVCRFGLAPLEYINLYSNEDFVKIKKELGIPIGPIVVTCGYNASPAQNHLEILNSLIRVKKMLPNNLFLIFPMTYGDSKYRENIIKQIRKTGFKYKVFDKFLSNEDVAKIRVISDIMIQVQTTDQLSGSMQEYLYAGNIVITGNWLPYKILKDKNCYFIDIDSINKLGGKLLYSISNLQQIREYCNSNKKIIGNLSLWENIISDWVEVYKNDSNNIYIMDQQPLVTVGIASYNHNNFIGMCIDSVLNQSYKNIEILVIDDDSGDGSKEIIKKYKEKYSNIKTKFHSINHGSPAVSFQEIINEANGDYFILLCSDDMLYNDQVIYQFVTELECSKKLDFVFGNLKLIDSKGNESGAWTYKQYTNNEIISGTFRSNGSAVIPMIGGIFRTQFYRKNNRTWFSDMALGETDTLNTLINVKYGCNIKYLDKEFIKYRQHNSNMTHDVHLVINARVQHLEFIIDNFNEGVYFPEISWNSYKKIEKEATKMFLLGSFYVQFFKAYFQGIQGPWQGVVYKLDDTDKIKSLEKVIEKINKYFKKCTNICNIYNKQIFDMQNQLNNIVKYNEFNLLN